MAIASIGIGTYFLIDYLLKPNPDSRFWCDRLYERCDSGGVFLGLLLLILGVLGCVYIYYVWLRDDV